MEDNRLWLLIARRLSGEITADQSNELQEILSTHPQKQYLFDILHSYFEISDGDKEEKGSTADPLYEENLFRILSADAKDEEAIGFADIPPTKIPLVRRMWPYAVAACLSLLIVGYYFLNKKTELYSQNKPAKTNEIISKSGVRSKLMLPDGTQVWLNAGSKLNYSNEFNQKLREVELEGEAFFDVVKDAAHPFIVHVSTINIKVKGTAFNVKSYPQDKTIETTLLRGVIEVSRKDNLNGPLAILKPNEKLILDKDLINPPSGSSNNAPARNQSLIHRDMSITTVSKTIPDSNKVETAWVYNRLVFDGESFPELAEKMERWYNVRIEFNDRELFHYRFKGAFVNETIKEALDALQLTAKFSYQINNNEIVLFRKKNG